MSAPRDIGVVIDEMLDHIGYVTAKAADRSADEFRLDRDIRQSVERSLEVISEASRHLPAELKNQMPEIPWRQLADLGNILRHRYFAVDSDIVWMIVQEHLQALRNALIILRNSLEQ